MDIKKMKELMAIPKEERQKQIKEFWAENDLKELGEIGKGIVVGDAYDFLFEGKNNEYDEEYKNFIEETKEIVKMDIDNIERKVLANVGVIDVKDFEWLIEQAKKYEKALKDIVDLEKGIEELQSFSYEQAEKIEQLEAILLKTKQKATEQIVKLEKENELLKVQLKKARTSRYNLGEGM